jgi:hypothetical protein
MPLDILAITIACVDVLVRLARFGIRLADISDDLEDAHSYLDTISDEASKVKAARRRLADRLTESFKDDIDATLNDIERFIRPANELINRNANDATQRTPASEAFGRLRWVLMDNERVIGYKRSLQLQFESLLRYSTMLEQMRRDAGLPLEDYPTRADRIWGVPSLIVAIDIGNEDTGTFTW